MHLRPRGRSKSDSSQDSPGASPGSGLGSPCGAAGPPAARGRSLPPAPALPLLTGGTRAGRSLVAPVILKCGPIPSGPLKSHPRLDPAQAPGSPPGLHGRTAPLSAGLLQPATVRGGSSRPPPAFGPGARRPRAPGVWTRGSGSHPPWAAGARGVRRGGRPSARPSPRRGLGRAPPRPGAVSASAQGGAGTSGLRERGLVVTCTWSWRSHSEPLAAGLGPRFLGRPARSLAAGQGPPPPALLQGRENHRRGRGLPGGGGEPPVHRWPRRRLDVSLETRKACGARRRSCAGGARASGAGRTRDG